MDRQHSSSTKSFHYRRSVGLRHGLTCLFLVLAAVFQAPFAYAKAAKVEPAEHALLRHNEDLKIVLQLNNSVKESLHFLRTTSNHKAASFFAAERRLQAPQQDPDCDLPSEFFGVDDVSASFTKWLGAEDGTNNFLAEMLALYVDETLLVGAKGEDIRDLDGDFNEVCNRLPLDDDSCYFTQNPDASFLETLVAKFIPFGEEVVNAKNEIDEFLKTVGDTTEDIYNFFLPDAEEVGVCFTINEDMFGIADNPGFPPPWIYEVCNCISIRTNGVPACTVQPYFRGFAFSTGTNNALKYDISDRLGEDFFLYDGYLQYKFVPAGDVWVSFDLEIKIRKISKIASVQNLICAPSESTGGTAPEIPSIPKITMKTSLFIQNDLGQTSGEGELLILAAIEELRWTVKKFIDVSLGTAVAALRVRSANPDCQPSGLFVSVNVATDLGLGEGLKAFLDEFVPTPTADVDFGVTWLDDAEGADDAIQSVFLRVELNNYKMMGIAVGSVTAEIQYFDDVEFERRRDFNYTKCCDEALGVSDCSVPNNALEQFIGRKDIIAQPTIGLFLTIQNLNWYGIVFFDNIELEFIFQLALDDFATRFFLAVDCRALFVEIDVEVLIELTEGGDNWIAAFSAEVSANVGIGTVTVGLDASAAVGDYTYDDSTGSGAVQPGSSLLDADWDLDFYADWQTAQWLEDLGELIYQGLLVIFEGIKFIWDAVSTFVVGLWNGVKELATAIGGFFADTLDVIGAALDKAGAALSAGIDALVGVLDGAGPLGEIAGDVLEALGAAAEFVIGRVGDAVDLVAGIFRGDWSAVGDAAKNLFGFSKSVSGKTEKSVGSFDEILGCPLKYQEWEECKRAFFVKYSCSTKRSDIYPDTECAKMKAAQIEQLKEDAEDAKAQEDCKLASIDRNQGLQWAGETDEMEVRSSLDASMEPTNFNIGMSSTLVNGACKHLPFVANVNLLEPGSPGTGSKASAPGTSSNCVDFNDLSNTLPGLQADVADAAKETSRGEQGLDKDTTVAKCGEIAGASCIPPMLTPGQNFQQDATVDCNIDFNSFNFESVFGQVNLVIDPGCIAPKAPKFKILSAIDDPNDGCSPVVMRIERSTTDCCKQKTNEFFHTLTVETLPPTFISEPGSMDTTLDCTANIHPEVLGAPDYEPGCPDALQDLEVSDAAPLFDASSCTTTIDRTFVVSNDGCMEKAQSFAQRITLNNDYDPEWDSFPDDTTVGVFADYGTDATGFPTVYQRCGASPVHITYTDVIKEGDCFAQRVLKRSFKAIDMCGHESIRTQVITIENDPDALPLGDKSLAKIYGRDRARIGNEQMCLWSSDECNVYGAPTDYECGKADIQEFSPYQGQLHGLHPNLNMGKTETSCLCPPGDISCDKRKQEPFYFISVLYGVPYTTSSGVCSEVSSMSPGQNLGTVSTADGYECPEPLRGNGNIFRSGGNRRLKNGNGNGNKNGNGTGNNKVDCSKKILTGTDPVYNLFQIAAVDLATSTIEINAPDTSVILINVDSTPKQDITIGRTTTGVILAHEKMVANNILWNVAKGVDIKLTSSARTDYNFLGTMLNGPGEMQLVLSQVALNKWQGQLFCDNLNANKINFECGHFTGFASCEVAAAE